MQVVFNRPQLAAFQALQPGATVTTAFGRGVGKSYLQELFWLILIAQWEHVSRTNALKPFTGVRIILFAPTFKQAVDIHGRKLEEKLLGEWRFLGAKIDHTKWRISFPGGSWIQFFGAENANAARGLRADVVTGDECDDLAISHWDAIVEPWLSEPWSLKIRLLGGTPRRGRLGLLYKMYRLGLGETAELGFKSFFATYRDAPETVDQEQVERLRRTTDPKLFAREWECSFESGQGLVYPMFDPGFHIRSPAVDRFDHYIIGGDWGFVDPGVMLVIGVLGHGADTVCHIIEEVWAVQKPMSWWVDVVRRLNTRYPEASWYYEHKPEFIEEVRRETEVRITPANKARGLGIQTVADALVVKEYEGLGRLAQLYVSPKCPETIKEFSLYSYRRDPRDPEKYLDDVDDTKHDHAMDSARYCLFSHFGGADRRIFGVR